MLVVYIYWVRKGTILGGIDLQLRGRSGRQGDPGSSVFYLSLEDDLMRLFGSDKVASIMDRMGIEEGEVITAGMITRAISSAQQKVEVRNFGVRKHLLEYDDVMNQQRQVVYDIRNQALSGKNMRDTVAQIIDDYIADEIEEQFETGPIADWDWDSLRQNFSTHLLVDISFQKLIEDLEMTLVRMRSLVGLIRRQKKCIKCENHWFQKK